ncbi:MAG: PQQ-dependent dehydrogenase, methanol/ethanol family [Gammaproteobacteria bacterium]
MKIHTFARNGAGAAVSISAALLFMAAGTVQSANAASPKAGQWVSLGRTPDEQRFSPLAKINTGNVGKLGLAWFADLDTNRGQEATPLYIDGVLYLSTAWSKVKAFDAHTGKLIWAFDPKVPGEFAGRGCCDVVNRGVAAWDGKIFVATYDGRLIAVDAKTGKEVWSVLTLDHDKPVTSTGAPRVANGKVIIGNAGSEFGVRGYVSAYDGKTGKLAWRFYTVPGNPAQGFEQPILEKAAKTWNGSWWDLGGGGTVWDGIVYDEKLNLVYFGTGNGSPWNRAYRGSGGGDNLFLASIVAVHADTGMYAWHYQQSPGEAWDYDATSPLMIADLKIGGSPRRVVMQASKNGYFYVLDAKSGQFISAKNFVTANWTKGFDPKTGRPDVNPEVRYDETGKAALIQPGAQGAHGWHPMSFNPQTGLVYFSGVETGYAMKSAATFKAVRMGANTGTAPVPPGEAPIPANARASGARLVAWDPVNQREAWTTDVLGTIGAGTLSTAGGLVFQGTTKGSLVAYRATDGKELWSMEAQTGVVAAPSTFEMDGEQYLAQEVGYGVVRYGSSNQSRLLVLKLGGTAALPPPPPPLPPLVLNPPPSTASPETIEAGHQQFVGHCAMCHEPFAANRSVFPDLRYSPMLNAAETFRSIVIDGALQANGMASFKSQLSPDQVETVRAYLIERANQAKNAAPAGAR